MKKYIPLYTDLQFKNLFGNKKNIKYTESLLENILYLEEVYLKESTIENSVNLTKEVVENKRFELDIVLKTRAGDIINLEMQKLYTKDSEVKNVMYMSSLFGRSIKRGEDYKEVKKVTGVNIVKDLRIHKDNKFIKHYCLINKEDSIDKILEEELNYVLVNINVDIDYEVEKEILKRWIKLIRAETKEEAEKAVKGNKMLEGALKEMERFANNEYVEDYSRQERLIRSQMRTMKEEGLEEGKQNGKESASFEIAKKMLIKNISIEEISELTGLSQEKIKDIKNKYK